MKEKSNQTKREIYSQNQQAHSQFKGGGETTGIMCKNQSDLMSKFD